ncbi:MAG: pectinesterase family protein [Tepidisphaeraceae bacterium]
MRSAVFLTAAAVLVLGYLSAAAVPTSQTSDQTVLTVAADGSGDFKTVQAAIDAVPEHATTRMTIHLKPGTYKERLLFPKEKPLVTLLGDDAATTVVTFNNTHDTLGADGKPISTSKSASVFIYGADFLARNVTFENSAGPVGQALAINIYGDRAIFLNCRFLGWQDTVMTNRNRQYFRDCYIAGHVDFIFGAATVYFKNCELHCRDQGSITAASTPQTAAYGYVFDHCKITSEAPAGSVILGRPWRPYGATIFLNTEMADCIGPQGWGDWGEANRKTARYAEYNSTGPGATPDKRAAWTRQLTPDEAKQITARGVLAGHDNWDPEAVQNPG